MDTNTKVILDLKNKIKPNQSLDFLSDWKGVPVIIQSYIYEIRDKSIVFRIEPPDSICLTQDEFALILNDVFIIGIRGRILDLDIKQGRVELGEFTYVDRGFGNRYMVRVLPNAPIPAELIFDKTAIACHVVDISFNGFGILTGIPKDEAFTKGQSVTLKLNLLDQDIGLPGAILGVFPQENQIRLAISCSQEGPGNAVITRYIIHRRADIRQEIQTAYQQKIE